MSPTRTGTEKTQYPAGDHRESSGGNMTQRILIVDDEPAILLSFRKLLQGPSLVVDIADRMEEAERLLKENRYCVVIADLRLTGVLGEEGLELLRYVKEHDLEAQVILITGYGSPAIMDKAFQMGAAYYFEKPVSMDLLHESLNRLGVAK
jgi:DNA-binding NtrC family response regulator